MIIQQRQFGKSLFFILILIQLCISLHVIPAAGGDASSSSSFDDSLFVKKFELSIQQGKLSFARTMALEFLLSSYEKTIKLKRNDIVKLYIDTFQKSYNEYGYPYFTKIENSLCNDDNEKIEVNVAKNDNDECVKDHSDWSKVNPYDLWDEWCSILPSKSKSKSSKNQNHPFASSQSSLFSSIEHKQQCCVFTPNSWTYLRLPAIHEPTIQLSIPSTTDDNHTEYIQLQLEQDGWMRPYDVAGVLWPTGYMLSLCLGDVEGCPVPDLHNLVQQWHQEFVYNTEDDDDELLTKHQKQHVKVLALELGAGIGASR